MREEIIRKTEEFMKPELMKIAGYEGHILREAEYRIEHSYRVAHIAAEIARKEGFDEEQAYVAGLLHDIGYSIDFTGRDDYRNHGRYGAAIARPFLTELGYSSAEVNDMCYGIAIHVDDKADFEGERTPLALTVGDADNIDRFDAFRLYEGLQRKDYGSMPLEEQREYVDRMLSGLGRFHKMPLGTRTATRMWIEKIGFQMEFYERLKHQIEMST